LGWEPLGGVFSSQPAVESWAAGRLDIFSEGTDNQIYHKWFDGGWGPSKTDWESLGTPQRTEIHFDDDSIVFEEGVPVGGFAHLTLRYDGTYTFSGHFHDSGATEYNVGLVWAVKDAAKHRLHIRARGPRRGHL
jgi:Repeat of unknown function (DUF346)